jgi:hypothetical protein
MGLSEAFTDLHVSTITRPHPQQLRPHLLSPQTGVHLWRHIHIPDEVTVQEFQVSLGGGRTRSDHGIVVVYGVHDDLIKLADAEGATFCNKPWKQLFQWTGITEADLWPANNVSSLTHG